MFCGMMAFDGENEKAIDKAILRTNPDMRDKIWKGISEQGKNFLKLCLVKD